MQLNFHRKLNYLFLFTLAIITHFSCQNFSRNDIHGRWEGNINNKKIIFNFDDNKICTLTINNSTTNSIFTVVGEYKIDFNKKPISLSINNIPNFDFPLYTILDIKDSNSIHLSYFSKHWKTRPIAFEKNQTIFLKRIKF